VTHWESGKVNYQADVVLFVGSSWQAVRDTAQMPNEKSSDWQLVAAGGKPGRSFVVRGTWNPEADYHELDVVTLDHGWFVARRDNPGPCPGAGWQSGPTGKKGEKGLPGERGPRGRDGLQLADLKFDGADCAVVAVMDDGSEGLRIGLRELLDYIKIDRKNYAIVIADGLTLSLRELFDQYHRDSKGT
jgi:hypothetical protein